MIWIRLVSDYNVNLFLRKDFDTEYDFIVGNDKIHCRMTHKNDSLYSIILNFFY